MEERKNPVILIVLILAFILSFLTCASFMFRVLMSIPQDGSFLYNLVRGNFELSDKIRNYPHDIIMYQIKYGDIYAGKFKASWYLSGALHLLIFVVLVKIFSTRQSLYGEARFATQREIQKAGLFIDAKQIKKEGLFAGDKIIVGKIGSRYIALGGAIICLFSSSNTFRERGWRGNPCRSILCA